MQNTLTHHQWTQEVQLIARESRRKPQSDNLIIRPIVILSSQPRHEHGCHLFLVKKENQPCCFDNANIVGCPLSVWFEHLIISWVFIISGLRICCFWHCMRLPHNSLVLLLTNFFYCLPPKLPPSSNQDAGSRNFHLWIQTKTLPPPSSKAEPYVVVFRVFKDWSKGGFWGLSTFFGLFLRSTSGWALPACPWVNPPHPNPGSV